MYNLKEKKYIQKKVVKSHICIFLSNHLIFYSAFEKLE